MHLYSQCQTWSDLKAHTVSEPGNRTSCLTTISWTLLRGRGVWRRALVCVCRGGDFVRDTAVYPELAIRQGDPLSLVACSMHQGMLASIDFPKQMIVSPSLFWLLVLPYFLPYIALPDPRFICRWFCTLPNYSSQEGCAEQWQYPFSPRHDARGRGRATRPVHQVCRS